MHTYFYKFGINLDEGKILKILVTIILIFFAFEGFTQEPLMPELPKQDSMQLKVERDIMYQQLLSGISPLGELLQPVSLPKFNFNDAIAQRWKYELSDYSFNSGFTNTFYRGHFNFSPLPFLRDETVFSQGSYQLNDKFKVGGYSFGANSVISAPLPNQNFNNYDFRGSTFFMQYKVSDKFKIETRVSVTQGR